MSYTFQLVGKADIVTKPVPASLFFTDVVSVPLLKNAAADTVAALDDGEALAVTVIVDCKRVVTVTTDITQDPSAPLLPVPAAADVAANPVPLPKGVTVSVAKVVEESVMVVASPAELVAAGCTGGE